MDISTNISIFVPKDMDYLEYKNFKGSVEYSKEDHCLFGKVQGIGKSLILYEGNTLDELRKDFEESVDSILTI